MKRFVLLWFPMIFIAVLNGIARDLWLTKYLPGETARQLSTFTLIILFTLYFYIVFERNRIKSKTQSFKIGVLWMVLTLTFEFSFGLLRGLSLTEIVADYNIMNGRIWILIPLWLLIAPRLFYKIFKPN